MNKKATEATEATPAKLAFDQDPAVLAWKTKLLKPFDRWSKSTLVEVLSRMPPPDQTDRYGRAAEERAFNLEFDVKNALIISGAEYRRVSALNRQRNSEEQWHWVDRDSILWIVRGPSPHLFVQVQYEEDGVVELLHIPESLKLFRDAISVSYEELDLTVCIETGFRDRNSQPQKKSVSLILKTPRYHFGEDVCQCVLPVSVKVEAKLTPQVTSDEFGVDHDGYLIKIWRQMDADLRSCLDAKNEKRIRGTGSKFKFIKDGDQWRITYLEKTISISDSLGAKYLQQVLSRPRKSISCEDLVRITMPPGEVKASDLDFDFVRKQPKSRNKRANPTLPSPKLDLTEYYKDTHEAIDKAEKDGDTDKAAELRNELARWNRYNQKGGPNQDKDGTPRERARKSVLSAINRVKKEIGDKYPRLKNHLVYIQTGHDLFYSPPNLIEWDFD